MKLSDSADPTVSVIIPAYRAAGFIAQALDSVLAQTYDDYEIIVVNDGSPDTEALEGVLAQYADSIFYIRQDNRGPAGARNTAIHAARGMFIGMLDADDSWMPEFLESQVAFIDTPPGLDVAYADCLLVGNPATAGMTGMQVTPQSGPVTFEALLQRRCWVPTSTVLARRRSLLNAGLFNEAYRCCEDFDLWLRMLHCGARFGYQTSLLARHREHADSATAGANVLRRAQIEVLENLEHTLALSATQSECLEASVSRGKALLALRRGKSLIMEKRYREAREDLARADLHFRSVKLKLAEYGLRLAPGLLRSALALRNHLHATRSARS